MTNYCLQGIFFIRKCILVLTIVTQIPTYPFQSQALLKVWLMCVFLLAAGYARFLLWKIIAFKITDF